MSQLERDPPDDLEPEAHLLHRGEFLLLFRRQHWEYVRRPRSSGACFVIAVTREDELVLVEQYRLPVQANTIELPAGILGDSEAFAGEAAEEGGLRELEEETGFRGARAELLFSAPTAAGLTSEMSHFVRVHDLTRVHAGGGVDDEAITVHLVPRRGIDTWLKARRTEGKLVDSRIYAALHLLTVEAP